MHSGLASIAISSVLFTLPARANAALDGAPRAVQQQPAARATPTPGSDAIAPAADAGSGAVTPVRFRDRPLSVNFMFGAGTLVGGFGGVVECSLGSRFALGAGMGTSWIDGERETWPGFVQVGALGRFRLALFEGEVAQGFDVVGGFSTGHFVYPILPGNDASLSRKHLTGEVGSRRPS